MKLVLCQLCFNVLLYSEILAAVRDSIEQSHYPYEGKVAFALLPISISDSACNGLKCCSTVSPHTECAAHALHMYSVLHCLHERLPVNSVICYVLTAAEIAT